MIDFRFFFFLTVVVIQSLSHVWLFETPCTATCQTPCPSLSPEFAQTHVHCVDNAIQPSHPLLPPSPPALNLSQHLGYFQWVSSLHPHGPQHTRLSCPAPSPGVCSNACPWSQWRHPPISSSVGLFSSFPQSVPESGSFSMSQLLTSRGQSTGASASASVFPANIQGWFPLGWTGWISLQPKGL